MGLDVYVGSLSRYYAGDWQTIVQQSAKALGMRVEVLRPGEKDAIRDPEAIRPAVCAWREQLARGLAEHTDAAIGWEEGPETPYFTDKPAWDCYAALLLWAAYDEHPELERPARCGDAWADDPAYRASTAEDFETRYGQLLGGAELWLPSDFPFTFRAPDLAGNVTGTGSSVALLRQLQDLNNRTWRAEGKALEAWRRGGAETGAALETKARFAYSLFLRLAALSAEHRLPMRLDY